MNPILAVHRLSFCKPFSAFSAKFQARARATNLALRPRLTRGVVHAMVDASHRSAEPHGQVGRAQVAPAAERNKEAILQVLKQYLPAAREGRVLEIASGTGQHVAHFAAAFPNLTFQPSEKAHECFESIQAYSECLPNILAPISLDTTQASWQELQPVDAVLAANITHISPWEATLGLLRGASVVLLPSGLLLLYGPFSVDGAPHTPGNAAFDQRLRAQDPAWGYRDIQDMKAAGQAVGLLMEEAKAMPADNFMLVFRKAS